MSEINNAGKKLTLEEKVYVRLNPKVCGFANCRVEARLSGLVRYAPGPSKTGKKVKQEVRCSNCKGSYKLIFALWEVKDAKGAKS